MASLNTPTALLVEQPQPLFEGLPVGENAEDAELAYGAAQLTPQGWRSLSGNETLTVHEAKTSLFKIKTPRRRDAISPRSPRRKAE